MAGQGVRFEERDGIVLLVLSRPDRLNALDTSTLETIAGRLEEMSRIGQAPKPLLLAAEGRVFSAGIDLAEVAGAGSPEEAARPFRALGRALRALLSYPAPTLAYVHGPAIAGGAELVLATDIVLMGPGGRLEWPEVRWNIVAPLLTALAARLGTSRLASAALEAYRIGADDAVALGLASRVVEGLDSAIGEAARLAGLYRDNTRAFAAMLPRLRSWKMEALDEVLPSLEGLAASMELVERARKFIGKI